MVRIRVDVHLVDLATGVCTPARPDLLLPRDGFAAERMPDGRIVCVGGYVPSSVASSGDEVYGPPASGAPDAAWSWRQLPEMSVGRYGGRGCVMSDGRFAVLGGWRHTPDDTPSCEASVTSEHTEHREPLPPMHDSRSGFACEAVAGCIRCIIVAGGRRRKSADWRCMVGPIVTNSLSKMKYCKNRDGIWYVNQEALVWDKQKVEDEDMSLF
jgi:hypothetical protein